MALPIPAMVNRTDEVKVWFYDGRTTTAAPADPSISRASAVSSSEICPRRRKTEQRSWRWRIALIRFGVPRSLVSLLPLAIPNLDRAVPLLFLTSYFPDCRTLSCFLEVSPSERDPPLTSPFFRRSQSRCSPPPSTSVPL